ncbi:MAG: family 16 glycoside hydrolase [Planctomycetota bacterium]|jgi:HEAT repeat protein
MTHRRRRPRLALAVAAGLAALATTRGATAAAAGDPTLDDALAALAEYRFGDSRVALTVVAEHVHAASGDPAAAAALEQRLVDALASDLPEAGARFVCRQLAVIGTAPAARALRPLLHDPRLCHDAAGALQVIAADEAGDALRAALADTDGACLVEVIDALAARRDLASVGTLARLAKAGDHPAGPAALAALGRLPSREAAAALTSFAGTDAADPARRRAVTDALVASAATMQWMGAADHAVALYDLVLARADDDHHRMAARRGRLECLGSEAVPETIDLLAGDDPAWRGFALALVRDVRHRDVTPALVAELDDLPDEPRALLLAALADRGDRAALPAVLAATGAASADVRMAAARAAGRLGEGTAAAPLARLAVGDDATLGAEAALALRRLRGPGVEAALAAALDDAPPAVGVELIGALADRRAMARSASVRRHARNADEDVRRAALEALARIGGPGDVDALVALVVRPETDDDREAAARALAATCLRRDDDDRAGPVAEAMTDADPDAQRVLLGVLGPLGGPEALAVVRAALDDPALRGAAIDALGAWPDDTPADDLLAIATAEPETAAGRAALRGFIRLAGITGDRPAARTVAMYGQALALAAPAGRRLALEGLGGVDDPAALALARERLGDEAVADAAALAVVGIADALGDGDRDLARAAIADALAAHDGPATRERAGRALDRIERDDDFIVAWRVSGPWRATGAGPTDLFDLVFPPERPAPDEPVTWAPLAVTSPDFPGRFDLKAALGGDDRCAYVATTLWADGDRVVRLELGSDDGIKAWVNGAVVHANNALRGLTVGSDRGEVALRDGPNPLLLKVTQGGGDWSFTCRVRDPLGFHAEGVRVATADELATRPADAIALFDGGDLDAWTHPDGTSPAWAVEDGQLVVRPGSGSLRTRDAYDDFLLHVGFMIPADVAGTGQDRGNSGVYLQGRYEVQVLGSWGQPALVDGCGAIYGHAAPRVNAARPPGAWQEYVVDFTAPCRDGDGNKVRAARISVWHNGVLVHDDVEVPDRTGHGAPEGPGPGPIVLQDHGSGVRYRDVWIRPAAPTWEGPDAEGFERLFDGASLDGWRRLGGGADYRAEDGQIVGTTRPDQPNSFLCTTRTFDDFVLELEFRVHPELNSGVQIRSNSLPDYRDGRVHGYQVEIDPSDRAWSAGIYDEARRGWLATLEDNEPARRAFRPDAWNRLRVVARGDTIRTWLNGVPAARLVDPMTPSGFIGLQVHGVGDRADPLEVRWRDVRVRVLD